jgi:phosphate transport system protein
MSAHLQRALNDLKKRILNLSARVEEAVQKATEAFETSNAQMAQEVIDRDVSVDLAEVEIEEECLKILALHQPVAVDLRFIVTVLKINNDLERVGDLAVNIAERACFLATRTVPSVPFDFGYMATKVQKMLKDSMDALVEMDVKKAFEVCLADDEVDMMNSLMYDLTRQKLAERMRTPGVCFTCFPSAVISNALPIRPQTSPKMPFTWLKAKLCVTKRKSTPDKAVESQTPRLMDSR